MSAIRLPELPSARPVAASALLALALTCLPAIGRAAPVSAPHLRVELIAESSAVQAGRPLAAGVRFQMEDGWHVYWKNPGDSGLPPSITFGLPQGWRAGELEWPAPERIAVGPLVDYGYSGELLLAAPIVPAADLPADLPARLGAHVEWLVCLEDCIPGQADLTLDLPVSRTPPASDARWAALFRATRRRVPQSPPADLVAGVRATADRLTIELSATAAAGTLAFFPAESGLIDNAAAQEVITTASGRELVLRRAAQPHVLPQTLAGILVAATPRGAAGALGEPVAFRIDAPIAPAAPARASVERGLTLPIALAFAFLGGLILNLMPCIFPVLSLKVLDFARQAGGDRRRILWHGLAYAAGVVASFLALAATLLALRAGGEEIGWGFQLQSPSFVTAMALLLFALALDLLGVVEVGIGLTGVAGRFASGGGIGGSFLTGVLATALATPCTAPFMGTAIAYALTIPAASGLLVFSGLGVGMAAPYVALCAAPGWLARLPGAGRWMETFKQALAFPLLATVIWLVWVRAEQGPPQAILTLLYGLLLLGMGLWLLGRSSGRRLASGCALVATAAGIALALAAPSTHPAGAAASDRRIAVARAADDPWAPFSHQRLESLRAAGRPVFIDFTAAWCLTCKVNEQLVFSSDEVQQSFRDRGVALLRADWTDRDPEVTRALEQFGRSGVPLYVLYAQDGQDPELLPSLLTRGAVLRALDRLPRVADAGGQLQRDGSPLDRARNG